MTKIISVNCGHTRSGAGYGAVSGRYKESEITRQVGTELIKLLKKKGHRVYNSTVDKADSQNSYLKKVVQLANNSGADLFISLHCNASATHQGHGSECWTYKGKRVKEAVNICVELNKLGFRDRGIKDGQKFYVVKHTKMPAVLVEMFFLDNETDQDVYKKINAKKIAEAIANAI